MKKHTLSLIFIFIAFFLVSVGNAQIWSNPIDGSVRPSGGKYTTGNNTHGYPITVDGIGLGSSVFGIPTDGAFRANGWTTANSRNDNDYFWFTLTPNSGQFGHFHFLSFNYSNNGTGPRNYELRYSIDGFSNSRSISTGTLSQDVNLSVPQNIEIVFPEDDTLRDLGPASPTIEFRLYAWDSESTSSGGFAINDFEFGGSVNNQTISKEEGHLSVTFGSISATMKNGTLAVNWQTLAETNNKEFVIQASRDGVRFHDLGKVASSAKNGNSDITIKYSFNNQWNHGVAMAGFSVVSGIIIMIVLIALFPSIRRKELCLITPILAISISLTFLSCNKNNDVVNERCVTYVRIGQIDVDGAASYSKVVRIAGNY